MPQEGTSEAESRRRHARISSTRGRLTHQWCSRSSLSSGRSRCHIQAKEVRVRNLSVRQVEQSSRPCLAEPRLTRLLKRHLCKSSTGAATHGEVRPRRRQRGASPRPPRRLARTRRQGIQRHGQKHPTENRQEQEQTQQKNSTEAKNGREMH